jgi:hypothetical protein
MFNLFWVNVQLYCLKKARQNLKCQNGQTKQTCALKIEVLFQQICMCFIMLIFSIFNLVSHQSRKWNKNTRYLMSPYKKVEHGYA